MTTDRLAVVIFNLGGPDKPEAVRPFLFNLFNDPAIIGAPGPVRWLLAKLLAARRARVARRIYGELGGGSPLLALTREQAEALQGRLNQSGFGPWTEARVFVAMRYWHPFADEAAAEIARFAPDRIVLLPLYPQFSTTTSGSSFQDWARAAKKAGLRQPGHAICCYPVESGLIEAHAQRIRAALPEARALGKPRVLFSAHGLPKKVIAAGDPYQWQVERTAVEVVRRLRLEPDEWTVCYQSRVGPLEWIGPSTEAEIERAGRDGRVPVVTPIAFVSEHSETLVEIEIEYRALARRVGAPGFVRVPALGAQAVFIDGLARAVRSAAAGGAVSCAAGGRLCPGACGRCPNGQAPTAAVGDAP